MRTDAEKEEARRNIKEAEANAEKYDAAGQKADARVARRRAAALRGWLTE